MYVCMFIYTYIYIFIYLHMMKQNRRHMQMRHITCECVISDVNVSYDKGRGSVNDKFTTQGCRVRDWQVHLYVMQMTYECVRSHMT